MTRPAAPPVLLAAALVAGGCASRTAVIHVAHPSPLSRWGRNVGVERFTNEVTPDVSGAIAQGLESNGAFRLTPPAEQQMRMIGRVEVDAIDPERLASRPHTCVRQVPEQRTRAVPMPVPDGRGGVIMQMVTQSYTAMVEHPYSCTELVRTVTARFRARVTVNALTRPIREVFQHTVALEDSRESTGLRGSDAQDHDPAPVDGPALLDELHQRAATEVLDRVLPRVEDVEVEFADCRDPRCDQGLTHVRQRSLPEAVAQFDAVVRATSAQSPDSRVRQQHAAALFNRGVVRGYDGALAEGVRDLTQAIALDNSHQDWALHLTRLRTLQGERERVRFRGETTTLRQRHGVR